VFQENKGILIIISENEVVSVKLSITTDLQQPLQVKDIARMKRIDGKLKISRNQDKKINQNFTSRSVGCQRSSQFFSAYKGSENLQIQVIQKHLRRSNSLKRKVLRVF
jgi:hypothetical protein